jgi:hypothetical protein
VDLTPLQPWLVLAHVLGVLGFVLVHGASAVVSLAVRRESDPVRIGVMTELSGAYALWGWIALLVILATGIIAGIVGGYWTGGQWWLWASLIVFIAIGLAMTGWRGSLPRPVRSWELRSVSAASPCSPG